MSRFHLFNTFNCFNESGRQSIDSSTEKFNDYSIFIQFQLISGKTFKKYSKFNEKSIWLNFNCLIEFIFNCFQCFISKLSQISKLCHIKHFICRDSIHSIHSTVSMNQEDNQLTLQLRNQWLFNFNRFQEHSTVFKNFKSHSSSKAIQKSMRHQQSFQLTSLFTFQPFSMIHFKIINVNKNVI